MLFDQKDRILFTGDSVTDARRTRPVGEGLGDGVGHGYVRYIDMLLSAFRPAEIYRLTNMAIGGQTSRDLVAQWDECMALSPDWVCIEIGVNDVWRQFDSPAILSDAVDTEEYEKNVEQMILKVKDSVKGIFILTPYYMEPNREDMMRKRMDAYGAICKKLADKYSCMFVDFQKMYEDYCKIRHSSYIAWDRIHPNQVGATLMAREFLKKCEFEY